MKIRPIRPEDEPIVREMSREFHGDRFEIERPEGWHLKHPTLVLTIFGGLVVGHTSWTPANGYTLLDETCVHRDYQGQGYGRALMQAREREAPGAHFGATEPGNAPMRHLLDSLGYKHIEDSPDGFGPGRDAMLYVRN